MIKIKLRYITDSKWYTCKEFLSSTFSFALDHEALSVILIK